jgi:hypothetical protein
MSVRVKSVLGILLKSGENIFNTSRQCVYPSLTRTGKWKFTKDLFIHNKIKMWGLCPFEPCALSTGLFFLSFLDHVVVSLPRVRNPIHEVQNLYFRMVSLWFVYVAENAVDCLLFLLLFPAILNRFLQEWLNILRDIWQHLILRKIM